MKIESYAGVMARLINGLVNQIRVNRKNHTYPPGKQWSDLVERRYRLVPTDAALDLLDDYPSTIGDVVLNHTYLSIVEERNSNNAKSIIPHFMKTYLWKNVSWDLKALQEYVDDSPTSEGTLLMANSLLVDDVEVGVNQLRPLAAIEIFGDHPNVLAHDVRVALVIDLGGTFDSDEADSLVTMSHISSYLHGTGFDIDSEKESKKLDIKSNNDEIAADVDFITKYTIGITVSFDGDETISHEWSTDVFADDNNFAIKKARKLLKAYCRDDVQIVRTRIIRKKRYIAQNTDEE